MNERMPRRERKGGLSQKRDKGYPHSPPPPTTEEERATGHGVRQRMCESVVNCNSIPTVWGECRWLRELAATTDFSQSVWQSKARSEFKYKFEDLLLLECFVNYYQKGSPFRFFFNNYPISRIYFVRYFTFKSDSVKYSKTRRIIPLQLRKSGESSVQSHHHPLVTKIYNPWSCEKEQLAARENLFRWNV